MVRADIKTTVSNFQKVPENEREEGTEKKDGRMDLIEEADETSDDFIHQKTESSESNSDEVETLAEFKKKREGRVRRRRSRGKHDCQVCWAKFKSKKELKNHMILHRYDNVMTCRICEKAFTRSSNYDKHLSKHVEKGEAVTEVEAKKIVCDICREEFDSDGLLFEHYNKHVNAEAQFYCDFCLKIYKKKDDLRKHRLTHISKPQYLCASCGKEYFSVSKLNEHRDYCLNERKYPCPTCGKKFNVRSQLTRHVTIHETDRYIRCSRCEKTFSRHDNFRQHFRLHTGEKPYTCDVCGKAFRIKGSMLYHRNKHDSVYRQVVVKYENDKSSPKVEPGESV